MEPSDETFDETHDMWDENGNAVEAEPMPRGRHSRTSSAGFMGSRSRWSGIVHSVLMAEGLHLPPDEDEMDELPRRFEASSSKAKLTWFGALCLAGIGMFVEAYIIITTGQIKTVWHAGYPTCFGPHEEVACPQNVECCGLFPNTPDTCGLGDECKDDGTYQDKYLCEPGVIGEAWRRHARTPESCPKYPTCSRGGVAPPRGHCVFGHG